MKKEVIIFLDLEANQEVITKNNTSVTIHKLLQLSAIKIVDGKWDKEKFNKYCHYEGFLNDKVRHLVGRPRSFFLSQKETEKEVYLSFYKYCEEADKIYCYGNYDQTVLDSVMNNNGLDKRIVLTDFSEEVMKRYHLGNKLTPSVTNFTNIFNIPARRKHNAFNDAFALWLIYKNVNAAKDDKKVIDKLYQEFLRPKNDRFQIQFFNKVEHQEIDDDYFYIFNKTKLINKYKYNEEKKDKEIVGYELSININIYNNKRSLVGQLVESKTFTTKKEVEDYMYNIYVSFVFNKIKNSVVIYDSGQKSEIGITKNYKRYTKNILPYYLVVTNKVEAHLEHFNKHFETEQGLHKYIMNSIRKFYDSETKSFNRIIKY